MPLHAQNQFVLAALVAVAVVALLLLVSKKT
jgi:hypothetical protein